MKYVQIRGKWNGIADRPTDQGTKTKHEYCGRVHFWILKIKFNLLLEKKERKIILMRKHITIELGNPSMQLTTEMTRIRERKISHKILLYMICSNPKFFLKSIWPSKLQSSNTFGCIISHWTIRSPWQIFKNNKVMSNLKVEIFPVNYILPFI